MIRAVFALLLLAVATSTASESRIVGGSPTEIERFPSIVQIERSLTGIWRQFCAGGILNARYILSSASCFVGPDFIVRLRRVRAGSSVRNSGGQVRSVVRALKHPSWNEGLNYDGDLTLVLLDFPLVYVPSVQQARILAQGAFVPDNYPLNQAGWGMTFNQDFPAVFAPELQSLAVITYNNAQCALAYSNAVIPRLVTGNMVCAIAQVEASACLGDRGSPLYSDDIIVGLVSWGYGCLNTTYPTVHTAVPSYTDWILANAI